MQGLINYNNITNPMAGDQVSASLPIQQNEFMRNSRLIPGRGIKLNQTPGGIIIEATAKDIAQSSPGAAEATTFLGKVTSKQDGIIIADLYKNGLNDEEGIIAKGVTVFPTITNIWQDNLRIGDCILVALTTTQAAGIEEVSAEDIENVEG